MGQRLEQYKAGLPDVQIASEVLTFDDYRSDRVFSADVIVVGSGAGGGAAAMHLAQAGLNVLILEEGPFVPTTEYSTSAAKMLKRMYRDAGTSMIMGKPNVVFAEGRCVGGSTVFYGGMTWRTPDNILHRWVSENGIDTLTPEFLDPYFEKCERYLNSSYQVPESVGIDSKILHDGAEKFDWEIKPNTRAQNHCIGTDNCIFGCPQGAKLTAANTVVPAAVRNGAQLAANCKVEKILTKGRRAHGVKGHFVDDMGRKSYKFEAYAPVVVLSCGARFTPALAMKSGIKAKSRMIGKNFYCHPNSKVIGIYEDRLDAWKGVHQGYQVTEFQDEGILLALGMPPPGLIALGVPQHGRELAEMMSLYNHMVVTGFLVDDSTSGRIWINPFGVPTPLYNITDYDGYRFKRGTALLAELHFEMGARQVMTGYSSLPVLNSPDDIPKLFEPTVDKSHQELLTVHIMGTMKMGKNPKYSVTNEWGELHDCANLFVADASAFPGSVGVNPTETIMALAFRNMQHIIDNRAHYIGRTVRQRPAMQTNGNGSHAGSAPEPASTEQSS